MISDIPLIARHPDSVSDELLGKFTANRLIYGFGETYASLITPSSCILDRATLAAITEDLIVLRRFYRAWNELYRAALAGEEPRWIADWCEYGLPPEAVQAQRLTVTAGLEPRFCRVDYISFSPRRIIAEVQWKAGGLGLFFGIHDVCASVASTCGAYVGNPVGGFRALVTGLSGDEPVVVNPVRAVWLQGESYLRRALEQQGVRYIVFDRRDGARRIFERNGALVVAEGGRLWQVDVLYGQELLPAIAPDLLARLARMAIDGRVWAETPLNYIYRQKWGMALPFMTNYARLFDDRLRELLGAVALLRQEAVDLTPLLDHAPPPVAQQLSAVRTIDDLAELSTAARRLLVLKCGAGNGAYYSQGRGVLRINGSHRAAQKTIAFVKERLAQGEPWIVQRYIDTVYFIDVCPPWDTHTLHRLNAHARFMVYATFDSAGSPRIIGGLGNFSHYWKVSGRSAHYDTHGQLIGAAFNDLRFARECYPESPISWHSQ
ncbi:hypothetical protein [Chloroflexus sp.]|uniref:hypothetical protein n=1 Tax=Chloroflexus sp. TaxID=1904827 RepID=UPI0026104E4F|nr:hypothetical protein [uncultured Chloroflexus sp.]